VRFSGERSAFKLKAKVYLRNMLSRRQLQANLRERFKLYLRVALPASDPLAGARLHPRTRNPCAGLALLVPSPRKQARHTKLVCGQVG
jgi:hypothetical protein